jgi:hypothetical protein
MFFDKEEEMLESMTQEQWAASRREMEAIVSRSDYADLYRRSQKAHEKDRAKLRAEMRMMYFRQQDAGKAGRKRDAETDECLLDLVLSAFPKTYHLKRMDGTDYDEVDGMATIWIPLGDDAPIKRQLAGWRSAAKVRGLKVKVCRDHAYARLTLLEKPVAQQVAARYLAKVAQ